jgi:V/A-type H+-transporting ATPase subunit I
MSTITMTHIQVMGRRADAPDTLTALRDLGTVQVDDPPTSDGVRPYQLTDRQQQQKARITANLSRVNGLLAIFDKQDADLPDDAHPISVAEALEGIATVLPRIRELNTRRERLDDQQDVLPRYRDTLESLLPLLPEGEGISAAVVVNTDEGQAMLEDLQQRLRERTSGEVTMHSGEVSENRTAMVITVPPAARDTLDEVLTESDIARLRLPIEDSASPQHALRQLERKKDVLGEAREQIDTQLDALADQYADDLLVWRAVLQQELDLYEMLGRLAQTERAFVLRGWVPAGGEGEVREALPADTTLEELPITGDEQVPVKLENPGPAEPFEGLLTLLGRPKYHALDPTGLMAIFLPLFFGMMLGDIGYGVVVMGIALFARSRFEGMLRNIATVIAMGGAWAVVWGILFGEMFGTLGEMIGLPVILYHRDDPEHVTDLLLLALGVGAAHVVLGLVIGVWRSIQHEDRSELMETGGKLIGLIAAFVLVAVLTDYLPQALMTPAIAGIIVGIVILGVAMGGRSAVLSPIEFVSTLGNIISYLRIAAIGLASVYLAVVANEIAGAVGSIVVGVIIAVLLHSLNIVLGMFTPTIQALRLHYVEFFSQFYNSGGRAYEPYTRRL